jgi:phage N-6-adenine-methyltransferase
VVAQLFDAPNLTDEIDDRGTPQKFFDALHREFNFTVDVAASGVNSKCAKFYDLKANGLIQSWSGERVWCNPPYSAIPLWVEKAHRETEATVVMLIPANRTEQPFWHTYIEPYRDHPAPRRHLETRFVKGRLKFTSSTGKFGSPPFGVVLLIWS